MVDASLRIAMHVLLVDVIYAYRISRFHACHSLAPNIIIVAVLNKLKFSL